jgi:hypothetical protein|tara:strand:+ start:173 stop:340 length:168 start_codon:yes stop_codon:yes gene_type:complete
MSETVWVVANLLARLMEHPTYQLGRISTFSKSNRSNKNGKPFLHSKGDLICKWSA